VITCRRRRPNQWKEFGHIPPVVQAMLASHAHDSDSILTMGQQHGGKKNDGENDGDDDDDFAETSKMMESAISLLSKANGRDDDYDTKRNDVPVVASCTTTSTTSSSSKQQQLQPQWLPSNPGEQLCNLVGRWRILQRVASHRWTTDDLVTAYVAASTFVSSQPKTNNTDASIENNGGERKKTIRYLDLGTGNASVLQMASWYLLSHLKQRSSQWKLAAVGVEARSEAVGLARRSLSFNLGTVEYEGKVYTSGSLGGSMTEEEDAVPPDNDVRIVQGDFRDLVSLSSTKNNGEDGSCSTSPSCSSMESVASERYDLITGTPPYFRVDFTSSNRSSNNNTQTSKVEISSSSNIRSSGDNSNNDKEDEVITSAVIQQGGMPTSMQSAPARCEFRGGIEAYCLAASAMLSPSHGKFVVCENWLNDNRVWKGAEEAGLVIECVWPGRGREIICLPCML